RADFEAATDGPQMGHHAAHRIEPEGRAAGKHEGVYRLDAGFRLKQSGIAHPRRAPVNCDRGDGGGVEYECGDAACDPFVMGVSHEEAGYVCDEVSHE